MRVRWQLPSTNHVISILNECMPSLDRIAVVGRSSVLNVYGSVLMSKVVHKMEAELGNGTIVNEEEQQQQQKKVLCLHGFRTSGGFLRKQISKWDPSIFHHFQMEFPDGLFPAGGKSDIEGVFPPPYFEWFQFNKEFTEYTNLEECISFLCDYITEKGPFDGLLGFSQGATLSALLICYQAQGRILKDHPPIKFLVSVSGSKFRDPSICDIAYKDPIRVKSVHFIGDKDWLKLPSEELATAFESPLIIRHRQGHTVPRLDEQMVKQLCEWTNSITQCSVPAETHDQETVETESKQESVVDLKNAEDTMVKIMT